MEFADKPEQEIIEAAQQGNEAAMEYLLKRYQGLMSYICDKYYLKDGERDDLMQEAMIGFMQSVGIHMRWDRRNSCGARFSSWRIMRQL